MTGQHLSQALPRIGDLSSNMEDPRFEQLQGEVHDRVEESFLALDVVVETTLGEIHGFRDIPHRGGSKTFRPDNDSGFAVNVDRSLVVIERWRFGEICHVEGPLHLSFTGQSPVMLSAADTEVEEATDLLQLGRLNTFSRTSRHGFVSMTLAAHVARETSPPVQ